MNTVGGGGPSPKLQDKAVTPLSLPTTVTPSSGYDALSSVTVNPDTDLTPDNVRKGVNMFGVVGTYEGEPIPTQEKTQQVYSFPTEVEPDDGMYLTKVTVTAPDGFTSENIREGVTIAGVTGTFEGMTDAEGEFWTKVVSAKEGTVIEAEPGLVTIDHCNFSISGIEIGPKGLDLSSIKTLSGAELLSRVTANGPITISCNGRIRYSTLLDLPLGDWTLRDEMFYNNIYHTNDIRIPPNRVPDGVIPYGAFRYSGSLSGDLMIHIPSTVTIIENFALTSDPSSGVILIMESAVPAQLGSLAISGVKSIIIPKGSLEAYQTATNWSSYADEMTEAEE